MLNPIRKKLQKMFLRSHNKSKQTQQSTIQSTICYSPKQNKIQQQKPSSYASSYKTQTDQQFTLALAQLSIMKNKINDYQRMTTQLQEKLRNHEQLEEFYLNQLKNRAEIEKQLKWKLEVIGEEIRNSNFSMPCGGVRRVSTDNQVLSANY